MWAQTIEVRRPLVFCSFLASLLFALAAEGGGPDSAILADMRQIRKFVSVEVQTQGTAEKLGISGAELTDMTRVTLLNKVPGIALEGSSGPSPGPTERLNQLGFFTCEVWTVGEQYIAAYHVDCSAGGRSIFRGELAKPFELLGQYTALAQVARFGLFKVVDRVARGEFTFRFRQDMF